MTGGSQGPEIGFHGSRVLPGAGTVLVGPVLVVLVDGPLRHPLVAGLAGPVLAGSGIDALVRQIASQDLADLPGFACVSIEPAGCQLLIRGGVTAAMTDADGEVTLHDGSGCSTWHEMNVQDATKFELFRVGEHGGSVMELDAGIVPAGRVELDVTLPSAALPTAVQVNETAEATWSIVADDDGLQPAGDVSVEEPDLEPILVEPDDFFDEHHLFEETMYRAPLPDGDDANEAPEPETVAMELPPPPPPTPPVPTHVGRSEPDLDRHPAPPPPAPAPGPGLLIDSVPGMGGGTLPGPEPVHAASTDPGLPQLPNLPPPPDLPPPPPVASNQPPAGAEPEPPDLEDATISAATLKALRASAANRAGGNGRDTVAAVYCAAGHPNPTHNDRCRVCDQEIIDRTTLVVDRPRLGRLRFGDGTTAHLDRHLIIGREPDPDVRINGEETGVVKLADRDKLMSRSHVAVQLDGWQVLVSDRDSMNHTFVELPGQAPMQLRPGEPQPIPVGTIVRIGEVAEFIYETEPL